MKNTINEINTETVLSFLDDSSVRIIDVRPVDAYNGWSLKNEKRGGHIKGARSLSAKWANYFDWIEIVRSKGILPEHQLIIYGYDEADAEKTISLFDRAGYKKLHLYKGFIKEWTANEDLPMEKLEKYQHLVHANWLNDLINDKQPIHYNGNNYVICHAHYRNPDDYSKGHIPNAIALDTLLLESPVTWNRYEPEILKKNLLELGITSDTIVVLYGRFSYPKNEDPFPGSSAGHLGAIRCAAIMLYAGVKDVKILNGGLQSWTDQGFETVNGEYHPEPVKDFGSEIPANPHLMIDTPEAKQLLMADDCDLVSVRSWPEFTGEVSGYNYIEKKGRIPGAIFGNCGSDAYHMENYRNLDHTMREYHEVEEIWKEANIIPEKKLAFYCGTGWRGSEAFFNAWLMGWPNISVYDGGWFEWSNDRENPFETGIPT